MMRGLAGDTWPRRVRQDVRVVVGVHRWHVCDHRPRSLRDSRSFQRDREDPPQRGHSAPRPCRRRRPNTSSSVEPSEGRGDVLASHCT